MGFCLLLPKLLPAICQDFRNVSTNIFRIVSQFVSPIFFFRIFFLVIFQELVLFVQGCWDCYLAFGFFQRGFSAGACGVLHFALILEILSLEILLQCFPRDSSSFVNPSRVLWKDNMVHIYRHSSILWQNSFQDLSLL